MSFAGGGGQEITKPTATRCKFCHKSKSRILASESLVSNGSPGATAIIEVLSCMNSKGEERLELRDLDFKVCVVCACAWRGVCAQQFCNSVIEADL